MKFPTGNNPIIYFSIILIAGLLLVSIAINPSIPFGRFTTPTQVVEGKITYAYGNGQLLASQGSDNQIKYYINDHLGSIRKVTDSQGNIISSNDYIAFGSMKVSEGSSRFRFTGKELDESGLYYYGARYYDSGIGRFITADTVTGNPADPQSLNRYSYTLNNPLRYVDPSGNAIRPPNDFQNYKREYEKVYNKLPGFAKKILNLLGYSPEDVVRTQIESFGTFGIGKIGTGKDLTKLFKFSAKGVTEGGVVKKLTKEAFEKFPDEHTFGGIEGTKQLRISINTKTGKIHIVPPSAAHENQVAGLVKNTEEFKDFVGGVIFWSESEKTLTGVIGSTSVESVRRSAGIKLAEGAGEKAEKILKKVLDFSELAKGNTVSVVTFDIPL